MPLDRRSVAEKEGRPEWAALPVSHHDAKAQGETFYFTGKPCRHGHVDLRYAGTCHCRACSIARGREWDASPEGAAKREAYRLEYEARPERRAHVAKRDREYRKLDHVKKKGKAYRKKYFSDPDVKDRLRDRARTRYRDDPEHRAHRLMKASERRAQSIRATPKWLTDEQLSQMRALWVEAASRDEPHQVDHIIPLQHPDVCGLNVPWNLQVLTRSENARKQNQFDGTHDNESWRSE